MSARRSTLEGSASVRRRGTQHTSSRSGQPCIDSLLSKRLNLTAGAIVARAVNDRKVESRPQFVLRVPGVCSLSVVYLYFIYVLSVLYLCFTSRFFVMFMIIY